MNTPETIKNEADDAEFGCFTSFFPIRPYNELKRNRTTSVMEAQRYRSRKSGKQTYVDDACFLYSDTRKGKKNEFPRRHLCMSRII